MSGPAYVRTNLSASNGAGGTSFPFALTTGYTSGNTAFALVSTFSNTIASSLSDTLGNTYTKKFSTTSQNGQIITCFACEGLVGGATTVTVVFPSSSIVQIVIVEYANTHDVVDVTLSGTGATGTLAVGPTSATTHANELVLAVVMSGNVSGGVVTISTPTGYTARGQNQTLVSGDNGTLAIFEFITSVTGTQSISSTITSTGTTLGWTANITAYTPNPSITPASLRVPDTPTLPALPSLNL